VHLTIAKNFTFEGEPAEVEDTEENENNGDNVEGEEEQKELGDDAPPEALADGEDLETAWEVLETARIIYSRMSGKDNSLRLADVHMLLADVCLESERFQDGIVEFEKALELKKSQFGNTGREVAEVYYRLGNFYFYTLQYVFCIICNIVSLDMTSTGTAFELDYRFAEAYDKVKAALDLLQACLSDLERAAVEQQISVKGKGKALATLDTTMKQPEQQEAEIESMRTIVADVKEKMLDLRAQATAPTV
jgi:tetratricopeptide (TPR) repeat protein